MVGFNRRFAPLLRAMKKDFGTGSRQLGDPVPGQRRPAGRGQLVPQRGGRRVTVHRRRRPLHRHAELVGGQPARGGLRGPAARSRATSRPPSGSPDGRVGSIAYLTGGNPRYPKETMDATGGGRSARLDNFSGRDVWSGTRQSSHEGTGRPGQGPAGRDGSSSSRRSGPAARCRSRVDSLLATTRATIAVGESLAERPSGASVSGARTVAARLVRPAGSAGCRRREMAWRARDQARQGGLVAPPGAAGTRLGSPPTCGERRFTAVLPAGYRRAGARRRPGRPSSRPRTGCCAASGRCSASSGPTWAAGLVPRPGDGPPVAPRTATPSASTTARGTDRQRQAGLGDLAAAAPHAARHRLVPHRRGAATRSGSPSSCAPGGGRTRSCPA